ncbi:Hypothetical Protein SLY_0401 [Strawberry lethal yellows phytoplasma (CPA) str. NZSb11]|uniref:Uncharacterized protein n=1 Tax=Strawberry lethal yellows phytoplasma (CPA) str. NZSb11 TaxID=980422 RepID=R4RPA9_PHYAS|nr:Hypothetical Protein SLY_0401 [Strawberry lethal yellows phytoplasma (CPA) str. NZSb11]
MKVKNKDKFKKFSFFIFGYLNQDKIIFYLALIFLICDNKYSHEKEGF